MIFILSVDCLTASWLKGLYSVVVVAYILIYEDVYLPQSKEHKENFDS